ncbi:MAG: gliding motility-associated C-terminal domain-containing protein, partial [Ignavibacteria bacterium]|nr:gliding motility-associated C-terminal domain-containing protein [Ignavibacteria bacterium]
NVLLVANPGNPCTDSIIQTIVITDITSADWFIANCFTPNDDGLNDLLEIKGLNDCSSYNLKIFNRWGRKIFESDEKVKSWDGKFESSNVSEGVYMYIINVEGKNYSGAVTLLR